ncbi:MAG TPA: 2-oxoglutarate dehydrogenase complex dihydrolipoyllysine-residue succinyltransferase [Gammaproteobacteria bacterium]|nr:2-oxoglutarate dehydrogenase complex dihydrolipoyllysine-residue succinyltransferase [Gammaproteobacteria bacterium]
MFIEVKVPVLAESIADATLLEWRKKAGEPVSRGENLIDLETDKVTLEVVAPESGVLKEIKKNTGDTVVSNEVLAILDTNATGAVAAASAAAAPAPKAVLQKAAAPPAAKLSPAARKLVDEKSLSPAAIPASGKEGRITKTDVIEHLSRAAPAAAAAPVAADRAEQRVAMTRLRKRAAERLLQAQHDNALLTTFNEVNMQPVMELRNRYKDAFEKTHGVKLGFMSFFARAVVEALKKFPIINASVDGDDVLYHNYFDLGIAVSAPRGLVVPVIRDADRISFADFEKRLRDLSEKARNGQLAIEDLTGGTFTITNGGVFGSLLSTPIVNPPQSAILGMHKIHERPVAENGQVVVRPMMYLAVSYDHRIIDGREAVQFLVAIKEHLEYPALALLEI